MINQKILRLNFVENHGQEQIYEKAAKVFRTVSESEPKAAGVFKETQARQQSLLEKRARVQREVGRLEAKLEIQEGNGGKCMF